MSVALEEREDLPPIALETAESAGPAAPVGPDSGDDPPGEGAGEGEGGPGPRRDLPLWLAVTAIVLVAALLTFVGAAHHIWSNLSGAHLPGA